MSTPLDLTTWAASPAGGTPYPGGFPASPGTCTSTEGATCGGSIGLSARSLRVTSSGTVSYTDQYTLSLYPRVFSNVYVPPIDRRILFNTYDDLNLATQVVVYKKYFSCAEQALVLDPGETQVCSV